jgi:6-phosphogluconolactonase
VIKRAIIICHHAEELAQKAAEQFVALAGAAIARSGRFTVALSGGSTPRALYSLLGSADYRERVDWRCVHLFWGDERCVPDHAESNYRMVPEALLSRIKMSPANIHRMAGEKEPRVAANEYEEELRRFSALAPGQAPRFELILLGLGEDGHTASLFPGGAAVKENERLVATAYVERLKAHRLTLTLPVINAAAQVTFLISGQSKRSIVDAILRSDSDSFNYPAARVSPTDGQLTWLITADAMENLPIR